MVIAVSAVQGAFAEQEKMLERIGVSYVELRKKEDLQQEYDAIILPGGESTVQGKLLKELGIKDTDKEIKARIIVWYQSKQSDFLFSQTRQVKLIGGSKPCKAL